MDSPKDRLSQLFESFENQQKACCSFETAIEQEEANIINDTRKLEELKEIISRMENQIFHLRKEQENLLETEKAVIIEISNERASQNYLYTKVCAAEDEINSKKRYLEDKKVEYVNALRKGNEEYMKIRNTVKESLFSKLMIFSNEPAPIAYGES